MIFELIVAFQVHQSIACASIATPKILEPASIRESQVIFFISLIFSHFFKQNVAFKVHPSINCAPIATENRLEAVSDHVSQVIYFC